MDRLLDLLKRIAVLKRAPKTARAQYSAARAPYKPILLLTILRRHQQGREPYASNRFEYGHDVFTDDDKPKANFIPMATVLVKCFEKRDGLLPTQVFPTWDKLQPNDVDHFLDFLTSVESSQNSYLAEIRACGSLPFGIVLLQYYAKYLTTNQLPDCLNGGAGNDAELHDFLRATYRVLIGAEIGQLGPIGIDALKNHYATLADAAAVVCLKSGSGGLNVAPNQDWLRANLSIADISRAKRILQRLPASRPHPARGALRTHCLRPQCEHLADRSSHR